MFKEKIYFQSPRKIFFGYRFTEVWQYACVYICMYVFGILDTPFNLERSNFDTLFVMWLSKMFFQFLDFVQ